MLFSLIFVTLVPFVALSSDESYFDAIQESVDTIESREDVEYAVEKACYPDIGCFQTDGLMKHIGLLPSTPTKIGTKFFAYSHDAPATAHEVKPHDDKSLAVVTQSKPLVIIIHGFGNSGQTPELLKIKDSLIKFANIATVIVVDWAPGAKQPWYTEAALNTEVVGREVAFLVETLRTKNKIDPAMVHLIGFSLGAQVSGFAGKFSQSQYKWKFGRISALDSASPLFEAYPGVYLDHNDATFVDAIHTSAGSDILKGEVGFIKPIGHVDFFPHNGTDQPRCAGPDASLACNHYCSVLYFEASLSGSGKQCTSYKCLDWADLIAKKCAKNADSRMGYYSNTQPGRGVHYSEVNKDYPFCQN